MTDRQIAIEQFLNQAGWGGAKREPLQGDASFRRYERMELNGHQAILMDAPPPLESVDKFVSIAQHLNSLGFKAPNIFAKKLKSGFLIIEDFGEQTFTKILSTADSKAETNLYNLAVDVLIKLHNFPTNIVAPPNTKIYTVSKLLDEAQLFCDWTWDAIFGVLPEKKIIESYQDAWKATLNSIKCQHKTLVLRDFHVDNLMLLQNRSGITRCGLLDFQDAVLGHRAYDLMSLLEDARRNIGLNLKKELLERYLTAFPNLERETFSTAFAILSAQRHAKVIGIFTRLCMRDGKTTYLKHIPRVWRLLESSLTHPSLAQVADWLDFYVPKSKRIAPTLVMIKNSSYSRSHSIS